jgi:hypothetical protein
MIEPRLQAASVGTLVKQGCPRRFTPALLSGRDHEAGFMKWQATAVSRIKYLAGPLLSPDCSEQVGSSGTGKRQGSPAVARYATGLSNTVDPQCRTGLDTPRKRTAHERLRLLASIIAGYKEELLLGGRGGQLRKRKIGPEML